MLFDGTLQTWELVALISLAPWLFIGVFSCISERAPKLGQSLINMSVAIGAIGMIVGVAAIIIGVAEYMPTWTNFKEFFLGILLMAAIIFAYFLAMGFLMLFSVIISALICPTPDDTTEAERYDSLSDDEDYD